MDFVRRWRCGVDAGPQVRCVLHPPIAACVRLRTRSLRRIALTCTLIVASAILIFLAMDLIDSPSTRQPRIRFSGRVSCGTIWSTAKIGSWSSDRCSSWPRTSGIDEVGKPASPIITNSTDLINTSRGMHLTKSPLTPVRTADTIASAHCSCNWTKWVS